MRRRASAASDRSTVRDSLMRASDSLILIRLSSCLGVAVMVCMHFRYLGRRRFLFM